MDEIKQTFCQQINYVIFKPKQKSVHVSSQISLDSIPLKQVTEVKFLGIYIDDKF